MKEGARAHEGFDFGLGGRARAGCFAAGLLLGPAGILVACLANRGGSPVARGDAARCAAYGFAALAAVAAATAGAAWLGSGIADVLRVLR